MESKNAETVNSNFDTSNGVSPTTKSQQIGISITKARDAAIHLVEKKNPDGPEQV